MRYIRERIYPGAQLYARSIAKNEEIAEIDPSGLTVGIHIDGLKSRI